MAEMRNPTLELRNQTVDSILEKRATLLHENSHNPQNDALFQHSGNLLLYDIDGNLADGAAEAETHGFLMPITSRHGIHGCVI